MQQAYLWIEKMVLVNQEKNRLESDIPDVFSAGASQYPGLERLKQVSAENLTVAELESAIADVDQLIAKGKVLLPENASSLLRALYTLLLALLNLGGVDPEVYYEDKDRLVELLEKRRKENNKTLDESNQDVARDTELHKVDTAVEDFKEAEKEMGVVF